MTSFLLDDLLNMFSQEPLERRTSRCWEEGRSFRITRIIRTIGRAWSTSPRRRASRIPGLCEHCPPASSGTARNHRKVGESGDPGSPGRAS
uniref:Uncharacterized protein n=1 Tax=Caenorhabditis elegans TaxID=6239 RepID=Q7Z147_CAEEL|eukprot:NP_491089.2 Uncharacterized protein CELE_Y54E10BL.1 [Caenorhabditis elegans]